MHADSFFKIGYAHDICEDYALFKNGENSYAIISDGCSGSSNTDFGARFLSLGMSHAIDFLYYPESFMKVEQLPEFAIDIAKTMVKSTSLSLECLDATVGCVFAHDNQVNIILCGDGAIAVKWKSGTISYSTIEYPSNAPPYLSYNLNAKRKEMFLEETNNSPVIIKAYVNDELNFSKTQEGGQPNYFTFPQDEIEVALVMSDGVSSFQSVEKTDYDKYYENVEPHIIIKELLSIKSSNGAFLKRRCKRIMKDYCDKSGWRHLDDFSVGGLYL